MSVFESIIFLVWIVGIVTVQFDKQTMLFINRYDCLGFFPGFFLFSPTPLYGFFKIKYEVTSVKNGVTYLEKSEVFYRTQRDLMDTDQKVIKCVNALCRSSLLKPVTKNINFLLLIHYVLHDARQKFFTGRLQFYIIIATNTAEYIKFKSRYYDL